jgi:tRNA(Arg) A34 adenosine deaminase TadA
MGAERFAFAIAGPERFALGTAIPASLAEARPFLVTARRRRHNISILGGLATFLAAERAPAGGAAQGRLTGLEAAALARAARSIERTAGALAAAEFARRTAVIVSVVGHAGLIAELRAEMLKISTMSAESAESPMARALAEARAAAARGEAPIGAVVTRAGALVAAAGNRVIADRDPTAEVVAIRAAAAALGNERLTDCDLYVTLEPCAMCAGAISHARIRRLYFGAGDEKGGAVEHGPRFFGQPTCHHAPEVYGGIREQEAADMLRAFFRERRS